MSFRRSKSAAGESRAFRDFIQTNIALLQASGVPISLYESMDLFDDLLMHGCIDHHPDPTHFTVAQLSEVQQSALIEVVIRYLKAGFPDPGISGLFGSITADEIQRRVQQDV